MYGIVRTSVPSTPKPPKLLHLFFSSTPLLSILIYSTQLNILHHFMYPNQASYKVIHPGVIGTTKKLSYSQTLGNWNHLIRKWDNFFIPTPMRFIQLPGVFFHHFMYPNQASYRVIHPGLIGTMKKLSYSQTGKLESPDLKVG